MLSAIFAAFAGEDTRPIIEIPKFPDIYDPKKHDCLSREDKAMIRRNDTFSHLLAMFPKLDVLALKELVRSSINDGLKKYDLYKELGSGKYVPINTDQLLIYARRLTKVLFDVVTRHEDFGILSNGVSTYEITNYLKKDEFGRAVSVEYFSAAVDQLIDEGVINTDVDIFMNGSKLIFRTFRPDGEFVTSKIIRNYYDL